MSIFTDFCMVKEASAWNKEPLKKTLPTII